jgi:catechol 2,3-dioxygenase
MEPLPKDLRIDARSEPDFISFGAVHLEVTDTERSAEFWETVFGFQRRQNADDGTALGTADETLVVLHGGALAPYQRGHSGLYHVAIHTPDERDFARLLKRLSDLQYPASRQQTTRFPRRSTLTIPTASTSR